jgi:excisionase family DNA binding protein
MATSPDRSSPSCNKSGREAWRVREFCEAVRISRSHLYALMKRGEIRTVLLGGRRLIPDSERARLLGEAA